MTFRLNRSNPSVLLALGVVLQALVFGAMALHRLIDHDEGLYLLAAKLVGHGQVPYRDFFYQQMPGLPYVYGLWMSVAGASWASGRLLSALLATALGGLLYRHVYALYPGRPVLPVAALFLYVANAMVLAWQTVAKTYALSDLLLFVAYLQTFAHQEAPSRRAGFWAGCFAALAASTRLYLGAAIVVLLVYVWGSARRAGVLRGSLTAFLAGLACGLAPQLVFVGSSARAYLFDNLLYHLNRSDAALLASLKQKLGVVFLLANLQPGYDALGGQFAMLAVLLVLFLAVNRNLEARLRLAVWLTALMFLVCLLPSPSFTQYFTVCVPYMIVGAIGFYDYVRRVLESDSISRRLLRVSTALFLLAYLAYAAVAVERYAGSGVGVAGIETAENAPYFRLPAVRQISAELNRWSEAHEPVLSPWPGYLVESHGVPVPGLENEFGAAVAGALTKEQAERYRLLTPAGLDQILAERTPRVAVLGNSDYWGADARSRELLVRNGYRLVSKLGKAEIYVSGGG